mgnify:CR=1 FL=1
MAHSAPAPARPQTLSVERSAIEDADEPGPGDGLTGQLHFQVPMMVAWYLHDRALPPRLFDLVVAGAIIVLPAALIIEQPDLGTALLVSSAGASPARPDDSSPRRLG